MGKLCYWSAPCHWPGTKLYTLKVGVVFIRFLMLYFQEKDGSVLALGRSEYGRLGLGEGSKNYQSSKSAPTTQAVSLTNFSVSFLTPSLMFFCEKVPVMPQRLQ